MPDAVVHIDGRPEPIIVRINGWQPTFRLATDAVAAMALREVDPVLNDLLEIAATVFAADGAVSRGGLTRSQMGTAWYRRFQFRIAVRDPDLWRRDDIVSALVEAVETLTEDSVSFEFTHADPDPPLQPYLDFDRSGANFEADEVILFSGGLDSFAGALERLASTRSRVVLVTHRSAQKAISRQVQLGQYLAERFPGRVLHVQVLARFMGERPRETTQRSRTLLFSALGQAVAQSFAAKRVCFFENGIVSHNLPLSSQIIGSMATRTTHPLALRKLDRLMGLVLPGAAPIENSYQWLTKSEVVARIDGNGGAAQIRRAVSCTSIREQNNLETHCGACSQCFDRRFAILHAGLAEHDPDEIYATDVLFGERRSDRSITLAVEWTRHALRLGGLEEQGFMERFGHEVCRILRGHPDLPRRTALELTLAMHRRHSTAVRKVLENVLRDRAPDFVAQRLPATSLVRLHLASGEATVDLVPKYSSEKTARTPVGDVEEFDRVPEPDAPLQVAFFLEGERHVVDVIGLTSVVGPPASVPHALKPVFDEDKRNGRAPNDHRFTIGTRLPALAAMNKDRIRKHVERCRKQLAEEYRRLHGEQPPEHLLIQTRSSRGYRLDPTIVVVTPNQDA